MYASGSLKTSDHQNNISNGKVVSHYNYNQLSVRYYAYSMNCRVSIEGVKKLCIDFSNNQKLR